MWIINLNFLGRVLRTRGWRKPKLGEGGHSKQSQVRSLDMHQCSSLGEISFLPPPLSMGYVLSPWDVCSLHGICARKSQVATDQPSTGNVKALISCMAKSRGDKALNQSGKAPNPTTEQSCVLTSCYPNSLITPLH